MITPSLQYYLDTVLPAMHGWCTKEKAQDLMESVLTHKPRLFVEIGVYAGRSFFAGVLAQDALGFGCGIGIDPWSPTESEKGFPADDANCKWWKGLDHDAIYKLCLGSRRDLRLEKRSLLLRLSAEDALPYFKIIEDLCGRPPIDLLHIDGNHSEECSVLDVESYVPLVPEGSQVWFDDVEWATTKPAQKRLLELCDLVADRKTYAIYRRRGSG